MSVGTSIDGRFSVRERKKNHRKYFIQRDTVHEKIRDFFYWSLVIIIDGARA